MRGEHLAIQLSSICRSGSSPHARGALALEERDGLGTGIIPACAGSTRRIPRLPAPRQDHPRMRGEHRRPRMFSASAAGSSPHARGAPGRHGRHRDVRGIIPACAGSTLGGTLRHLRRRDHPRMRGEHCPRRCTRTGMPGSSPHARGALTVEVVDGSRFRIIPACAGSTAWCEGIQAQRRDHPRMRGEHRPRSPRCPKTAGSSPHARGAQFRGEQPNSELGIIPACAGSTDRCRRSRWCPWDHPRMRGEHSI